MAVLPLTAAAQTAYKGRVIISEESFARQGDLLRVKMKVNYGSDVASPGETLTLTPVLKNDTAHVQCSSVVIKGDDLKRSRRRLQGNYPVAVNGKGKNQKKGYSFTYDTTVPYAEWLPTAAFYIESVRNTGKGGFHSYEDKILDSGIQIDNTFDGSQARTRAFAADLKGIDQCVQYLLPASDGSKIFSVKGILPFTKKTVHSKKFEKTVYDQLMSVVSEKGKGHELFMVRLQGYSAPEGNYRRNERLGVLRQLNLKEYLMEQKTTSQAINKVLWTAEDWDSIAYIVRGTDMHYRQAVLDIIKTTDVAEGREDDLKALAKGKPYKYLMGNIFPRVYRVSYDLVFRSTDNDLVTGTQTSDNEKSRMTYSNLFGVAQSYGMGSESFRELMSMGARLFPNSVEANINAAAAALTEGRLARAEQLLKPYATNEKAYCNLGVLYLLQGNKDKAEVYLKMAEKNGVKEAANALARTK